MDTHSRSGNDSFPQVRVEACFPGESREPSSARRDDYPQGPKPCGKGFSQAAPT